MKIDLSELRQRISKIKLDQNKSYLLSYPYFIDYFKLKNSLSKQDLICGVFMIYGWMPTILKNTVCTEEVISLFNKAKCDNNLLSDNELKKLIPFTNNSLVGLSKLLHFINPKIYPIWDRKICKYFYINSSHYQVQNISNYLKYIDVVSEVIKVGLPNEFNFVRKQVNYQISDVRLVEMIIFYTV